MRKLLDRLELYFAAAIAGLTVMSQVPHPLIPVSLPTVRLAWLQRAIAALD